MISSRVIVRSALASKLLGSSYITVRSCHHHKKDSKVAVVLSGCGVYDGSEIYETTAILVNLSRGSAKVSMYAPDIPQMHVINHCKGEPAEGETRNVLIESARLARGKVQALSDLKSADFDAVIFPGGFGAAKNLCTFAVDGSKLSVNNDVARVLKEFHSDKKPIGMCCIAPVLAAKVLEGCEVTVGPDSETAEAIQQLGAKHVTTSVTDIHIDEKQNIITTAAYMCEAPLHDIADGIGKMVSSVLHRIK